MRLFCRLRPGVLVITTIAVIAAMGGLPVPDAQAFYIQNHERITRDALTPIGVDNATQNQILVGPPPGAGAVERLILQ
ncbi:hypothetical protein Mycsm_06074 [Mycobacterium sp. JS623]|uniref:hypothetical protein n=1 Tax=Mycobacterium sp. JS623 TaxID=212767 RepID=UPI0002A5B305|nr:hypothetical protein [Mycobacterium sp. JS623]AGB26235.1 hypothetical protein Mycsm_06074 [Mycobacterium sp. JS623]